jgi:hypothetical protein
MSGVGGAPGPIEPARGRPCGGPRSAAAHPRAELAAGRRQRPTFRTDRANITTNDDVAPGPPSSMHRPVGLTVAGVAAPEVGVGGRDVGAGEVVDRDRVGAAERGVVDPLHVVEVHNGAGKVAEEAHALAVGGRVDRFGGGRAVEAQSVGAGLVLDRVVVVTGVPDERLVALCRFGRYAERFPGSPAKRRSRARKIGITLGRPVNATPLVTVWRSLRKPGCRLYGRLLLVDTRSSALPSTSRPLSAGRRA